MDIYEMYLSGNSITAVNKKTGIPLSTLRNRFKKKGILRGRDESIALAGRQGKLSHLKGKKRIFTDSWKNNIRQGQLRHWKDKAKGLSLKPSGYLEITRGENKGRSQHVVIVEKSIGRRLFRYECVHHKNENKTDNRIENLQLTTIGEHARLHRKKDTHKRNRNKNGQFMGGKS
jgi:hypothetical protein